MRFEASLRYWIETDSLEEAERAILAAQDAAYAALGPTAIDDPELGGMCGASYHGIDDEAVAALTEDDHGPGREFMRFQTEG